MSNHTISSKPVAPKFSREEFEAAQTYYSVEVNSECKTRVCFGGEPGTNEKLTCDECPAQAGQFHVIGCEHELCPECGKPLMQCEDAVAFD